MWSTKNVSKNENIVKEMSLKENKNEKISFSNRLKVKCQNVLTF